MWLKLSEETIWQLLPALQTIDESAADYVRRQLHEQARPEAQKYREAAHRQFHEDGELEFDDYGSVSISDECSGAYVMGWRWVDDPDAG